MLPCTAVAHPNIAFIKYWGNRNDILRLPANGSISMNLEGLETRTTVEFDGSLASDELTINGKVPVEAAVSRVSKMLDEIRALSGIRRFVRVTSQNNFPSGAGIASSASAFAALTLAASKAAGMDLDLSALSRLARRGSGSACRSIPGGFVEWAAGMGDEDSYAASIAPQDHWDLVDCIAVISREHKLTGSTEGHAHAVTSPLQAARLDDAPRRLEICRQAVLNCDFSSLVEIIELDSNLMHAVMMTSRPPLFYWLPATMAVMHAIRAARDQGLSACYTIDAGPNVHVICLGNAAGETVTLLEAVPGVRAVLKAKVGGPARLVEDPLHDHH
jgi:diphosphomevalonate decarboxylase